MKKSRSANFAYKYRDISPKNSNKAFI